MWCPTEPVVSNPQDEDEINSVHKRRWGAAIAHYGHKYDVPPEVRHQLDEMHRLDWVANVESRGEKMKEEIRTAKMQENSIEARFGVPDKAPPRKASVVVDSPLDKA